MIISQYLRHVSGFVPRTIVHVGAHIAGEIDEYQTLEPETVVWVEADPLLFRRMQDYVAQRCNGRVTHVCINALITDSDGTNVVLNHFSNDGASSSIFTSTELLRTAFPGVEETGRVVAAKSMRLDSLLRDMQLSPEMVDVLVLDVQGAELLCLKGAGDYLHHLKFLEVEVSQESIYVGAPLFDELDAYITAQGFVRVTEVPWHGDVVYANTRFVQIASAPTP